MDIQTIVSMVSNVIVLLLFFAALISCVIGLKRGFYRALVSLIVWVIGFAIVFGFNMTFTELYFNFDLSIILKNFGNFVLTINENQISLLQSVGDIIIDIMVAYDLETATEATKALAMSVLSIVVLFLHLIIACFICPIVILIINQTFTKHVIEKISKKKLRLAGFFVNGLKTSMVFVVLLSPVFNIIENICNSFDNGLDENYQFNINESNEIMMYAYPAFNGYNNSMLHKLFSVVTGSGTYNDYYTANVTGENNVSVNFMEVVDCVASVAVSAFSNISDLTNKAELTTAFLADHTLEVFTNSVLSSTFLMSEALPIALNLGIDALVNMEDADSIIISEDDAETIKAEIGDIDFSADLSSYVELFRILNEEGVITDALIDNENFDYELSRDNQKLINKALKTFKEAQESIKNDPNKTTILDVILPPVLSSLVKNYSTDEMPLDQMLPVDPNEYRELDLIEVMQVASDVIFNVNDLYVNTASNDSSIDISGKSYVKKQNDNNIVDNLTFKTINKLVDQNYFIRTLFKNENVFNGVVDSRDNEKIKTIKTIDLFAGNENDKGILDIEFLLNNFQGIVDFALTSISNNEDFVSLGIDQSVLDNVSNALKGLETRDDWEQEVNSLLNCMGTLFDNDDFPIITVDETDGKIKPADFSNQNEIKEWLFGDSSINVVKELCTYIDDSKIICTVFPAVIKTISLDVPIESLDISIKISGSDFNFDFVNGATLGSELGDLFEAFGFIMDCIPEDGATELDEGHISSLKAGLEVMADCQIINNLKKDENGKYSNNLIKKIVTSITSSDNLAKYGLSINEDDFDEILASGELKKELNIICDTLSLFVDKDSSLNAFLGNVEFDVNDLINNEKFGENIEQLINTAASSKLLKTSLSSLLEKNLNIKINEFYLTDFFDFSVIDELDENAIKVESAKIRSVIENLRIICNGEQIGNIHWDEKIKDTANKQVFADLFKNIQSLCFLESKYYEETDINKEKEYDRFGMFIYSFLDSSIENLFKESSKEQIKKDFSFVYYQDEYFKDIEKSTFVEEDRNALWDKEITVLMDVLSNINSIIDGDNNLNIDLSTTDGIDKTLKLVVGVHDGENIIYGINDSILFRTILSDMLVDNLKNDTSIGSFDLDGAYIGTEIFNNELNFKSNLTFINNYNLYKNDASLFNKGDSYTYREVESILRRNEINLLFSIAKDLIEIGSDFNVDNIDNWLNGDFMFELLTNIHDSKLLHNPSAARNDNDKITVFEKVIDVILENSVSSLIYKDADPKLQRLEIIRKITSCEIENNNDISWNDPINGEIYNLYSSIKCISNGCTKEDGEKTNLYNYLLHGTGSINISALNEDKNHCEIEVIISSLSKSLLINPDERISSAYSNKSLLGLILDDNIGSQLNVIGMDNHSFVKSNRFDNNWSNEANALSNLVNTFKSLSYRDNTSINIDDLSSVKWTNIKVDDLRKLLLGIYKVPSIAAVYEVNSEYDKSSYEDIIYYVVEKSFDFNSKDKSNIMTDIYSINNWFTENEINNIAETNIGETNKFVNLLDSASSANYGLIDDNGTFDLSKFSSKTNNKQDYGVKILKELNNIDFLRTVFASIFENSFSDIGISINGLDTNKVYKELFSNELNYKNNSKIVNRSKEIQERNIEIDYIIEIVISYDGMNEILNKTTTGNIQSLSEADVDYSFDLLNTLQASRLFHVGRYGIDSSDTTFFEDAVMIILEKGGILENIYDSKHDKAYLDAKSKMKALVRDISFNNILYNANNSVYLSWTEELNTLKQSIKSLINIDGLIVDGKISANNLTGDNISTVLNALNNSYLTHDSIGKFIKNICEDSIKISSFQIDPNNETNRNPDYYLDSYGYENESFVLKINAWNKEINCISDFKNYLSDKSISSVDSINFDQTYAEGSIKIADILEKASKSNVLKPMFSDFIYTMIKNSGLNEYISTISSSDNINYLNYKHEYDNSDTKKYDKMRRDTIDYLSDKMIIDWNNEGEALDNMISSVKGLNDVNISDSTGINDLKEKIPTLFGAVYKYKGAKYDYTKTVLDNSNACASMINFENYTRGYLASELMLNFLDKTMKTYGVTYFSDIKYDYSYICFNDYEKDALDAILDIAYRLKTVSNPTSLISFEFTVAKKMGPGESSTSEKRDAGKVLLTDGWNSNIAIQLLNNNYLEGIINASLGLTLNNIFVVNDKPIECASNSWGNQIKSSILGGF